MVFLTSELMFKYKDYGDPKGKIRRLVKEGKLFPVVKGIYEDDKHVDPMYLAPWICSPSYLSFDYALSLYGMIPETAYNYTSASFGKRKTKIYETAFGVYTYQDVPKAVYSYGVKSEINGSYSYHIATREKALADKLYSLPPIRNMKEFSYMLFEDLRIYEEEFRALNMDDILFLAPLYHSTNLDLLSKLVTGRGNGKRN